MASQIRTNLTQFEVIALEEARFIMCEACKQQRPNRLVDSNAWPNTCNSKAINVQQH
jgi:hypothetical protein